MLIDEIDFSSLDFDQIFLIKFKYKVIRISSDSGSVSKIYFNNEEDAYSYCAEFNLEPYNLKSIIIKNKKYKNIDDIFLTEIFRLSHHDNKNFTENFKVALEKTLFQKLDKFKQDDRSLDFSFKSDLFDDVLQEIFNYEMNYSIIKSDAEKYSNAIYRKISLKDVRINSSFFYSSEVKKQINQKIIFGTKIITLNENNFYINSELYSKIDNIIKQNVSDLFKSEIEKMKGKIQFFVEKEKKALQKEEEYEQNQEEQRQRSKQKEIEDKQKEIEKKQGKFYTYLKKVFSKKEKQQMQQTPQNNSNQTKKEKSALPPVKDYSKQINEMIEIASKEVNSKLINSIKKFNEIYKIFTNLKVL
jgi:hypothetical protein